MLGNYLYIHGGEIATWNGTGSWSEDDFLPGRIGDSLAKSNYTGLPSMYYLQSTHA